MQSLLGQNLCFLIFVFPRWDQSLEYEWVDGWIKGFFFSSYRDRLCIGFPQLLLRWPTFPVSFNLFSFIRFFCIQFPSWQHLHFLLSVLSPSLPFPFSSFLPTLLPSFLFLFFNITLLFIKTKHHHCPDIFLDLIYGPFKQQLCQLYGYVLPIESFVWWRGGSMSDFLEFGLPPARGTCYIVFLLSILWTEWLYLGISCHSHPFQFHEVPCIQFPGMCHGLQLLDTACYGLNYILPKSIGWSPNPQWDCIRR